MTWSVRKVIKELGLLEEERQSHNTCGRFRSIQGVECRRVDLGFMAFLGNYYEITLEVGWDILGADLKYSRLGFLLRLKSSIPSLSTTPTVLILFSSVFSLGRGQIHINICVYVNNWYIGIHQYVISL